MYIYENIYIYVHKYMYTKDKIQDKATVNEIWQHHLNFENKMKFVRIHIRVKWSLEELYTYKSISCE